MINLSSVRRHIINLYISSLSVGGHLRPKRPSRIVKQVVINFDLYVGTTCLSKPAHVLRTSKCTTYILTAYILMRAVIKVNDRGAILVIYVVSYTYYLHLTALVSCCHTKSNGHNYPLFTTIRTKPFVFYVMDIGRLIH